MEVLKTKLTQVSTIALSILMFNFSIYLAEIDAMQRFRPNQQLVDYLVSLADIHGLEEDQTQTIEVDLFLHLKNDNSISSPYYMIRKQRMDTSSIPIYHPQEAVTPPPEV